MYMANFNRKENWAECSGIRFTGERMGDTFYPLCRLLVAAGHEDDSLKLVDERGMHCMTIHSIHRGATRMIVENNSTTLRTVKYVENNFDYSNLQPVVVNDNLILTKIVYEYLQQVLDGKWSRLHGKTQNSLLRKELVMVNGRKTVLTDKGEAEVAAYEVAHPPKKAKEEKEPRVSHAKVIVTPSQAKALEIVKKNMYAEWLELHGKTTNTVVREGWVKLVPSADGTTERPVLTEIGQRVLTQIS